MPLSQVKVDGQKMTINGSSNEFARYIQDIWGLLGRIILSIMYAPLSRVGGCFECETRPINKPMRVPNIPKEKQT